MPQVHERETSETLDRAETSGSEAATSRQSVVFLRLTGVTAVLSIIAGALVFPFPMRGRLWGEIFDLAHAPVFCGALLCLAGILDPQSIGLPKRFQTIIRLTVGRILVLGTILLIVGGVCEYLQKFAGRSPSLADMAANCIGVLAALLWMAACRLTGARKLLPLTIASGLLLAVSIPSALQAWDCVEQIRIFPVLASFERSRELGSWQANQSDIERISDWSTDGDWALKVTCHETRYSGIAMTWFQGDWTGLSSFQVDLANPGDQPLHIIAKINDLRHWTGTIDHNDRFHGEVTIPPKSHRRVSVNLSDVKAAPASREMDMHEVALIEFFSVNSDNPTVFYVDNLRLNP